MTQFVPSTPIQLTPEEYDFLRLTSNNLQTQNPTWSVQSVETTLSQVFFTRFGSSVPNETIKVRVVHFL
jgi:hypothetical protein